MQKMQRSLADPFKAKYPRKYQNANDAWATLHDGHESFAALIDGSLSFVASETRRERKSHLISQVCLAS